MVDFCEFDKYAVKSYCAVHNELESKNLGDVTKVDGNKLPYADLMVWGFPCTDISVAGLVKGFIDEEGNITRSGLYYEGLRILRETMPKYSIIENVKNLVGKKFKAQFETMLEDIKALGYNNYWKVLNAKDYGIPQNRERVFIISIRADADNGLFEFPEGFDNELRLKDFLEDEVDEKYYISQEKTDKLLEQLRENNILSNTSQENHKIIKLGNTTPSGKSQCNDVLSPEGIYPNICAGVHGNCNPSILEPKIIAERGRYVDGKIEQQYEPRKDNLTNTLTTVQKDNLLLEPKIIEDFYKNRDIRVYEDCPTLRSERIGLKVLENKCIQVGNLEQPGYHESCNRVYSPEGIARTLMGGGGNLNDKAGQYLINYRVRRLTAKECWRLMGFSDEDFQKARDAGISDSQLYKQAGNSIVTNVLAAIFINLLHIK